MTRIPQLTAIDGGLHNLPANPEESHQLQSRLSFGNKFVKSYFDFLQVGCPFWVSEPKVLSKATKKNRQKSWKILWKILKIQKNLDKGFFTIFLGQLAERVE